MLWYIFCFSCVVLFVFLSYHQRTTQAQNQMSQKQKWNDRVFKEGWLNSESILIFIPCLNLHQGVQTAQLFIQRAYVPQRVRVVVCGPTFPTDMKQIEDVFFQERITVTSLSTGTDSYFEHMKMFGTNEKYLLLTRINMVPNLDWDLTLIRTLQETYKLGGHLVTQHPALVSDKNNSPQSPGTFSLLQPNLVPQSNVPFYRVRFLLGKAPSLFRSLSVHVGCLFGETKLLLDFLVDYHIPGLNIEEANFLMGLQIYRQRCHVFCGAKGIVSQFPCKKTNGPQSQQKRDFFAKLMQNEITQEYLEHLGIEQENPKRFRGNALLGVTTNPTSKEIRDKYGSMFAFEKAKRHLGVVGR